MIYVRANILHRVYPQLLPCGCGTTPPPAGQLTLSLAPWLPGSLAAVRREGGSMGDLGDSEGSVPGLTSREAMVRLEEELTSLLVR